MSLHAVIDQRGEDYGHLLEIQASHIMKWRGRLKPEISPAIEEYILSHNCPAATREGRHRVWRGQDIFQIIYHWPDAAPCFPSTKPEDVI